MPKLDGLGTVVDFLNDLTTPKIAAQIAKKVLGLAAAPLPPDSRQLHGYPDFRRVDCGEFRIIYRYRKQEDVVEMILVAKRNDDEVYRRLRRLLD